MEESSEDVPVGDEAERALEETTEETVTVLNEALTPRMTIWLDEAANFAAEKSEPELAEQIRAAKTHKDGIDLFRARFENDLRTVFDRATKRYNQSLRPPRPPSLWRRLLRRTKPSP